MTNQVVMNDTANVTLHIGGSPIMSSAKEEIEDLLKHSKALVLNYGTLTNETIESMSIAGKCIPFAII